MQEVQKTSKLQKIDNNEKGENKEPVDRKTLLSRLPSLIKQIGAKNKTSSNLSPGKRDQSPSKSPASEMFENLRAPISNRICVFS